jgi:hypothetical protein
MNRTRIDALKEREREIRAQIAAEQMRLARRKEKDNAKLFSIVGEALVQTAAQNPEGLGVMLRQVLSAAVTDDRERQFLAARGWLRDETR